MLFNSLHFLVFFPIACIGFFALPPSTRRFWILAVSCYFYGVFIPQYLWVLLVVISIDYLTGRLLEEAKGRWRTPVLALSLSSNLGVLFLFKCFNFFHSNVEGLAHAIGWNYSAQMLALVLPIGLSFHTFQSMAYTIEVYRDRVPAERDPILLACYVMFFPQLVAGPIERPQNLLAQLHQVQRFDYDRAVSGLRLMLWGFVQKVLIADNLAPIVNAVFAHPSVFTRGSVLLATVYFSIQIYADFAGYSNIAIGAARVMGFNLMQNFDAPYFATSLASFWRRWHISLSSWFRDYVYIPLGGNRTNGLRWSFNILIVFLLSGLWHGASWGYVLWGLWHGGWMVVSRWTQRWREKAAQWAGWSAESRSRRIFQAMLTWSLVTTGWIFFRSGSVTAATDILGYLATALAGSPAGFVRIPWRMPVVIAIASFAADGIARSGALARLNNLPAYWRWCLYVTVGCALLNLGHYNRLPFIYFQF